MPRVTGIAHPEFRELVVCPQCNGGFFRDRRANRVHCSAPCRFWARVEVGAPHECWPWKGTINPGGYGVLYRAYGSRMAHRQAWELVNKEPVPGGMYVLHHCDNRPCCNPSHHFLGTKADNNHDMYAKGRDCHSRRRAHAGGTALMLAEVVG